MKREEKRKRKKKEKRKRKWGKAMNERKGKGETSKEEGLRERERVESQTPLKMPLDRYNHTPLRVSTDLMQSRLPCSAKRLL